MASPSRRGIECKWPILGAESGNAVALSSPRTRVSPRIRVSKLGENVLTFEE